MGKQLKSNEFIEKISGKKHIFQKLIINVPGPHVNMPNWIYHFHRSWAGVFVLESMSSFAKTSALMSSSSTKQTSPELFWLTFKLFNGFQLKIDGFGVLEGKYHMEIAPERRRNATRILGNGFGIIYECTSSFLDIFSDLKFIRYKI